MQQIGISNLFSSGLDLAALARYSDPTTLAAIQNAANMQTAGQLAGLEDWLRFNANKGTSQLADALQELQEAQRLHNQYPNSIIRIAREPHAPMKPGTADPAKEFDISIEDPNGIIQRTIEMTSVQSRVSRVSDLTPAVRHATDKAAERASQGIPIPGAHDVTISMDINIGIANIVTVQEGHQRTGQIRDTGA